jgi:hypothetical protein
MQNARSFTVKPYTTDFAASKVEFSYTIELEDSSVQEYRESLQFPATPEQWTQIPTSLLESLLQSISLALGTSYWKMHCAPQIIIEGFSLSYEQSVFWNTLYTKGLGEFFYKNKIDYRDLIQFPFVAAAPAPSTPFKRSDRSLVPLGGGKDSLVTVELMKKNNKEFDLYSLSTSEIQKNTSNIVGKPMQIVTRKIDLEMARLSKSGQVHNGHIPISSIYMFVGLLEATLCDYRYVIFSNESSSNIGNVEYLGHGVNHQWSKSKEFEMLARKYIADFITPDIQTFSLLRPLSELEIVHRFTEHPQYFNSFSSCNRNFVVTSEKPESIEHAYWCGECPKCAFVFACLTAFLPKDVVVKIVGKDMYADKELLSLYKELLGLEAFKPFECVGEPDEVRLAMYRAYQTQKYHDEPIMQMFEDRIMPTHMNDVEELEKTLLSVGDTSTIPDAFKNTLS